MVSYDRKPNRRTNARGRLRLTEGQRYQRPVDRPPPTLRGETLPVAAKPQLRFVNKVRTENRNILLEPRQHGLAYAQRLDSFLVGAGEQVLVMWCRPAEEITNKMWNREMHGCHPFLHAASETLDATRMWDPRATHQHKPRHHWHVRRT